MRLSTKVSFQAAGFRLTRSESLLLAFRMRLYAVCIMAVKLAELWSSSFLFPELPHCFRRIRLVESGWGITSMTHSSFFGQAFINCDDAVCRYEPDAVSPARIVPPYGTFVAVIDDRLDWVQIGWVGKLAWSVRSQLSIEKPEDRIDIKHYLFGATESQIWEFGIGTDQAEYGPRGGRFTRTRTGHRRYF